jgi:hypothetical protein
MCFAQGGKTHGKKLDLQLIPPTSQDQKYDAKPVRTKASNTIVSCGIPARVKKSSGIENSAPA